MFENPILSFLFITTYSSFIGYGISLLILETSTLKRLTLAPIFGYAIIGLLSAYLSYFGLPAAKFAIYAGIFLFLFAGWGFYKNNRKITEKIRFRLLILIVLCALINGGIVIAPMALEQAPYLMNDHTAYISISEYLQRFGYFIETKHLSEFWQLDTSKYQDGHLRMGGQFFTAFFTGLLPILHTISIYPSILTFLAFSLVMSIAFLYFCLRQNPKTGELAMILLFFLMAVNLNSQIIAMGFMPQSFGLALMITLVGLLFSSQIGTEKPRFLLALLFASLILTYHEIAFFFLSFSILFSIWDFYKNKFLTETTRSILIFLFFGLLFSPIGTWEFIQGIILSIKTNGVGWPVNKGLFDYLENALGQDAYTYFPNIKKRIIFVLGTIAPLIFSFLIFKKEFLEKEKSIIKFFSIFAIPFLGVIFFYRFYFFSPFDGTPGHTWNIFKVVNWIYWIIPFVSGLALYHFYEKSRINKILASLLIVVLMPSPIHNVYANYFNHKLEIELYTNNYLNPIEDFKSIVKNKANIAPANIIDTDSHFNYRYLTLVVLADISTADFLNFFGWDLIPSTKKEFYNWINYRWEHVTTAITPKMVLAGFKIYEKDNPMVYLMDGFGHREENENSHWAWMIRPHSLIKAIVPEGTRASFSVEISNWSNRPAPFTVFKNKAKIFEGEAEASRATIFHSPPLEEGFHVFEVKYHGEQRVPDQNDGRSLAMMFKNLNINKLQ